MKTEINAVGMGRMMGVAGGTGGAIGRKFGLKMWRMARAAGRAVGASTTGAAVVAGLLAMASSTSVIAGPEGEQVVVGNVTFTRQGNMWVITASNGAIINYASFDILPYETVRFIQPSALSTVLNRINSAAPTLIQGTLEANGNVFFVNPAGVIFGHGATVNVGGLYAAAGNISNEDFLAGNMRFTNNTGSVVNQGNITANAVALVGKQVSNSGTIVAQSGTVVMAAGTDVFIGREGSNIYTQVSGATGEGANGAAVENTGRIVAGRGQVLMSAGDADGMAIFNTGAIQARTIKVEGQGTGEVIIKGTLDASSMEGRGGDITITGEKVGLFGANVDASGVWGGGTIHIGGEEGGGGNTRRADYVFVDETSTVRADAHEFGDGGRITFWGTEAARIGGTVSAMGGVRSGNGGFIETSGGYIAIGGTPMLQARSASGRGGTWVIDPNDITIVAGGGNTNINANDPFASTDDNAQLGVDLITAALGNGVSVSITTTNGGADGQLGNITLATDLIYSGTGDATLTLNAHNDIVFTAGVTVSGSGAGGLNLVFNADSDNDGFGNVNLNDATLTLFGGGLTVASTVEDFSHTGILNTAGGNVVFSNTGSVSATGTISLGAGDLTVGAGGTNVTLGSITGSAGSDLTFNNSGTVSLSSVTTGGSITSTAGGLTTFGGGVSASSVSVTNAASIGANITTTGTQSYGATTLTADVTLTGVGITFSNTVDSDGTARALIINDTGTTTFGNDVGGSSALASLTTIAAGQTVLGGNVTTTGAQFFQDSVLLSTNVTLTGAGIRFGSSLNSQAVNQSLVIVDSGQTRFDAAVGSVLALASLDISGGGTTRVGANIITTGAQTYGNALAVAADLTLTSLSGAVTFNNTVDATGAGVDLTIAAVGGTTVSGVIGGGTALNSISFNGGPIVLGSNITTVAGQTYGTAVTLSGNVVLTSTGSGAITFSSTLDGNAAGRSLTVDTAGVTTFTGVIGGAQALQNLTTDAPGTLVFGDAVTLDGTGNFGGSGISFGHNMTATNLTFGGPVTLTGNSVLNVVNATFSGTVNADDEANNRTLQVDLSVGGVLTFSGAVGDVERLASLTVTDAGAAQTILTGNVSTIGAQSFASVVTIAGNLTLTGTNITFGSAVDADAAANNRTLTIATTGGSTVTFTGSVGSVESLGSLSVSDDGAGTTVISNSITTSGAQTYNENVTLGGDITLRSTGGAAILFAGTVDSDGTARAMTVDTAGLITFTGAVGGTNALSTLTTTGGGATTISGGVVRTTTLQSYGGAVNLTANTILTSDDIDFAGNVSGSTFSLGFQTFTAGRNIELGTASGNPAMVLTAAEIAFLQNGFSSLNFGDAAMTGSILVTSAVTFLDATTMTVDGVGGGLIRLGGDITMNDSAGAATLVLGGPVQLDSNVTLASNGVGANGDITFTGAVNADNALNNRTLTVNTAGTTTFTEAVGGVQALGALTTDSGGTTRVGGNISISLLSAGGITFNDAVVLIGNSVMTAAGDIVFGGTLDADDDVNNRTLDITTSGVTRFSGIVGATEAIGNLTTSGPGTVEINAALTSAGAIVFNNAVVTNGAHITGGSVTFASTVDAAGANQDLVVTSTAGDIAFQGAVGGLTGFRDITTSATGGSNILTASLTALRNMTLGGATRIDNTLTLTAERLNFGGDVNANAGGIDLTITSTATSGAAASPLIVFGGSVGNTTAFSTLIFSAINMTDPAYASVVFRPLNPFNSDGSATTAITLNADTIDFGVGHRVLAVGNFTINAATALTIGDLSSAGNLNVTSNLITVRLRDGGRSETSPGSADNGVDLGADWVALGSITANGTLQFDNNGVISGSLPNGKVFSFAVGSGRSASGTATTGQAVTNLAVNGAFAQALFQSGGNILGLDLTAKTSFEQPPIAGLNPRIEIDTVSTPQPVSSELAEFMRSLDVSLKEEASLEDQLDSLIGRALYVDMADPEYASANERYRITRERLTTENVLPLRDTYRAIFQKQEGFDANGDPIFVDDIKRVRDTLATAWKSYKAQTTKADGKGFRSYLEADEANPENSAALEILRGIAVLFEQIDRLGLSDFEAQRPRNSIINRALSPDIGMNEAARQILRDAIAGEQFTDGEPMALMAP